jgi:hypothetical protein
MFLECCEIFPESACRRRARANLGCGPMRRARAAAERAPLLHRVEASINAFLLLYGEGSPTALRLVQCFKAKTNGRELFVHFNVSSKALSPSPSW